MAHRPSSRQELVRYLEQRMNLTYTDLIDEQELEADTSLIKTYLVEAHLPENAPSAAVESLLQRISQTPLPLKRRVAVDQTKDPTLYWLSVTVDKEPVTVYIDVTNPRFWLLHSANRSTSLDWLLDRLVKEQQSLDRAWIWPELLNALARKGSFRGLGLDYDRRAIPDIDFEAPGSVQYLKMQLWGMQAAEVLRVLSDSFPAATTLAKVKVKYWLSDLSSDAFSIDDIKFDGKITARGTSFQSHIALVTSLYSQYAETIRLLERQFTLAITTPVEHTVALTGDALAVTFARPILNLPTFCEHLLSAALPFRLWGVPTRIHDDFYRASGLDLHSGSRIDLEVAPEFMRLYLPSGSCGNTVLRLYTNLKHFYDSQVAITDGDGRPIL